MKKPTFYRNTLWLISNFIKYTPKIIFRFLKFLFQRKKLVCKNFRPDAPYCIEGTLNQLLWEVENAVFITLSNSSQLFFDSGQLLFHVKEEQTKFQLIAYGVVRKQKLRIQIKVAVLNKNDFTNVVTKPKSISVDYQKTIISSNMALMNIGANSISFQKSLKPKLFRKMEIDFNHLAHLTNYSRSLANTNSKEEVNQLRDTIECNNMIT